jgi:hypothetical protein
MYISMCLSIYVSMHICVYASMCLLGGAAGQLEYGVGNASLGIYVSMYLSLYVSIYYFLSN